MLVRFQARQLSHASVLWLNRRWFLERQFDLRQADTIRRIHTWLLDEFAYAVPQSGDPPSAFTHRTKIFHADRYGSSTGRAMHGGSGRVATDGAFQAKGIGVTPLVGAGGEAAHSIGCCSLEEAVREAIYSEVAVAEFPHGAVPVIAILTTGLVLADSACSQRAIVVRPAVVRIAHAERAPMFKKSVTGFQNSQSDDVTRTRDVVQKWTRESLSLPVLVTRIAEQIAFGQVHRIFNGGYFSSNLTTDGAILDYGGMRALANWANVRNLDGVAGFGNEMKIVDKVIESLAFFFAKYQMQEAPQPQTGAALRQLAQEAHKSAFQRECLRMWGIDATSEPLLTSAIMLALGHYFSWQQTHRVDFKHGDTSKLGWLHDEQPSEPEAHTLTAIASALRRHFAHSPNATELWRRAWATADRYLMPRESLDREALKRRIEDLLAARQEDLTTAIQDFVRTTVARGRRHWPRLPCDLTVLEHVSYEGSAALLCEVAGTRQREYWLEGPLVRDALVCFDSELPADCAHALGIQSKINFLTARVPASSVGAITGLSLPKSVSTYGRTSFPSS